MWFPHSSRAPFARGLRWHSIGVLLLAVGSRLLAAQSTSPEKTSSPEVLKLSVTGVRHVDHHDLDKSISTQASRCNSPFLLPFCLVSKSERVSARCPAYSRLLLARWLS
jgi:hypothetical protein